MNPGALKGQKIEAVVNVASGSVGAEAADQLGALLSARGLVARIRCPDPGKVGPAVREAAKASPDLLIVLAGDGTANLAARLCGVNGPLIAPLPGGTMNMLPHAIYGKVSWQSALEHTLDEGEARTVSGGEVSGSSGERHPFYVAAILGEPALWADAREAMREGRLRKAWVRARHALSKAFSGRMRFYVDGGPTRHAEALSLMCPLVSRAMQEEDALEAAALDPKGAAEAFRLGMHAMLGDWRADPSVSVTPCQTARVWARGRIPALLDGEPVRLQGPVTVRFRKEAFRVLAPPPLAVVHSAAA